MKLLRRVFIFCFILTFFSQVCVAAPQLQCDACKVYIIAKGQAVPEDGVLYNNMAYAVDQSSRRAELEKLTNDYEYKLKMQRLDLMFTTSTTAIALDFQRQENIRQHEASRKQIDLLQGQLEKHSGGNNLFIYGLLSGIALTIGSAIAIGYASNKLGK